MPPAVPIDLDYVRARRSRGDPLREIARELGVGQETIRRRLRAAGDPPLPPGPRLPERNRAWRGGRIRDKQGYVLVHRPDHPHATKAGYVREHRLVAEAMLGRYLLPTEVVHHRDGSTDNNTPGNLVVFENNGRHLATTTIGFPKRLSDEGREKLREVGRRLADWNRANRWASESDAPPSR